LLSDTDPQLRAAGVRAAQGTLLDDQVRQMMRTDRSPDVRGAAVEVILQRRGAAALAQVLPSLVDSDPRVRSATAAAIGSLGSVAAPPLLELALQSNAQQAQGAILALEHLGPAGVEGLQKIASDHPDQQARRLAGLALGRPVAEH
jgi:HEAT repeat protein